MMQLTLLVTLLVYDRICTNIAHNKSYIELFNSQNEADRDAAHSGAARRHLRLQKMSNFGIFAERKQERLTAWDLSIFMMSELEWFMLLFGFVA